MQLRMLLATTACLFMLCACPKGGGGEGKGQENANNENNNGKQAKGKGGGNEGHNGGGTGAGPAGPALTAVNALLQTTRRLSSEVTRQRAALGVALAEAARRNDDVTLTLPPDKLRDELAKNPALRARLTARTDITNPEITRALLEARAEAGEGTAKADLKAILDKEKEKADEEKRDAEERRNERERRLFGRERDALVRGNDTAHRDRADDPAI